MTNESTSNRLTQAIILIGLICLGVVGYGTTTGWFKSLGKGLDGLGEKSVNRTQRSDDSSTDMLGKPTNSGLAKQPSASDPTASIRKFSPPPLDALAPSESEKILAECGRVSNHLIELMPTSLDALEMKARYEFEFGKIDSARALWNRILDSNPRSIYALRGLSDIAFLNADFSQAATYLRQAVVFEPSNTSHQVKLGVALLAAEEPEEARTVLEAVTVQEINNSEARIELGTVLVQLGEFQAAKSAFEVAMALSPDNAKVHFGLATVFRRLGDTDKAKYHQTEHQRLQVGLKATLQSGRRNYDDVAALQIDVAKLYIDMARVYIAGGHLQAAEFLFVRVSRTSPASVECRQALAWLARVQSRPHEAIRWLRSISELEPEEFVYANEIANLYLEANQLDDAGKTFMDFVAQNPKHAEAAGTTAQFFLETQPNLEKAMQYGRMTIELKPTGESYVLLSTIYEVAGKLDDAVSTIQRAIELDPTNAAYPEFLTLLRQKLQVVQFPANGQQR